MLRNFLKLPSRSFGSTAFITRSYELLEEAKQRKVEYEAKNKTWLNDNNAIHLPEGGIYKHPYCTKDFPLTIHTDDYIRDAMKLVGPEQVSPHF
jgi:hypothetical protein